MLRVLFFGSSDYCVPILNSLKKEKFLTGVITRPDRKVGRKQILTPSPIKEYAQAYNIPFFTPESKDKLFLLKNDIEKLHIDLAIVADYGLIIPKQIFELPKYKTLNIHFSRLPYLRGASPVQYSILLGEEYPWITVIKMDETMDTGDIIWQKEIKTVQNEEISMETETTQSLYKKLFSEAANQLPIIIKSFIDGSLTPKKQDHSASTYTERLQRNDGFVPWNILYCALENRPIDQSQIASWPIAKMLGKQFQESMFVKHLSHEVRAFSPWPGVWTIVVIHQKQKRLKILSLQKTKEKGIIASVQLEGKNPVSLDNFLLAYPLLESGSIK